VTPLPFPVLRDEAVLLRPWHFDDVEQMLAAFSDPVFREHSDWAPTTDSEVRQALVDGEEARQQGTKLDLAVVDPDLPHLILGGVSLNWVDPVQARAAVGYWLAPAARGRGVASRAVRLLTGWAFDVLQLQRLELTCGPDNIGSQRVAERTGFTREGLLRSHMAFKGRRRDTLLFSLLPGELGDSGR